MVLAIHQTAFAEEVISNGTTYRLKDFKSFFEGSSPSDVAHFTPCGKYFWTAISTLGKTTFFVGERDDFYAFDKSSKKIFVGGDDGDKVPLAINNNLKNPIVIREIGSHNPRFTLWMSLREYLNSPCLVRGNKT